MNSGRRFTLDSNVLIYAADRHAGARQAAAISIIARAAAAECVLTPQSLAEFFQAATRKKIIPRSEAAGEVRQWMIAFSISAGPTAGTLRTALTAAESGRFQFYDALLLATAGAAGCSLVISEDMADGAELDGVRVIAAFDPAGGISAAAEALLPAAAPG